MQHFGCFVGSKQPKGKVSDILVYWPAIEETVGQVPIEYVVNGEYIEATFVCWLPSFDGSSSCPVNQIQQYLDANGLTATNKIGWHTID